MDSPATTNRNNGNQSPERSTGAVLSWKPGNNGNANELITLEKDKRTAFEFPEVLQKTIMVDNDEVLDFAQSVHHCLEFEIWDILSEIQTVMALRPSVNGLARQQFMQALVGVIIDTQTKKSVWNKDKRTNEQAEKPDK